MELTREIKKCPNCNTPFGFRYPSMKFCPFCGEEVSEKEVIKLEDLFAIEYIKGAIPEKFRLHIFNSNLKFNPIEILRGDDVKTDEVAAYINEHLDDFIEISSKFSIGTIFYINKSFPIKEILIDYEFSYEEGTADGLDVSIILSNQEKHYDLSEEFRFYLGVGIGKEGNATHICKFTEFLYNAIKSFSVLPEIRSSEGFHNDFCPYGLRDIVEKTIEQYSKEFPEEYSAIVLAEEVKD